MLFLSPSEDLKKIKKASQVIRDELYRFPANILFKMSYFLLALDRFPLALNNFIGTVTFITPTIDNNYSWIDVEFTENALRLNHGEYFSEGYHATHNIYETNFTNLDPVGDIHEWLSLARIILTDCSVRFDFIPNNADVEWDDNYLYDDINIDEIKKQLSFSRMLAVAHNYYEWISDPNFGDNHTHKFKQMANSILLIAHEVGPKWDPPDPEKISLIGFLGRKLVK